MASKTNSREELIKRENEFLKYKLITIKNMIRTNNVNVLEEIRNVVESTDFEIDKHGIEINFQEQFSIVKVLESELNEASIENKALVAEIQKFDVLFQELERDSKSETCLINQNENICFKDVETQVGIRRVLSLSKTLIQLKDLIIKKKQLEEEVEQMKALNATLTYRVNLHEVKLINITDELNTTWSYVNRLKDQHRQLHTSEQVLRAELTEKRSLLATLRQELEYSRLNWNIVKQKTAESEKEWQSLRDEFAERRKTFIPFRPTTSSESGISESSSFKDEPISEELKEDFICPEDEDVQYLFVPSLDILATVPLELFSFSPVSEKSTEGHTENTDFRQSPHYDDEDEEEDSTTTSNHNDTNLSLNIINNDDNDESHDTPSNENEEDEEILGPFGSSLTYADDIFHQRRSIENVSFRNFDEVSSSSSNTSSLFSESLESPLVSESSLHPSNEDHEFESDNATSVTRFLIKHLPKQLASLKADKADLEEKLLDLESRYFNQSLVMAEMERRAEQYRKQAELSLSTIGNNEDYFSIHDPLSSSTINIPIVIYESNVHLSWTLQNNKTPENVSVTTANKSSCPLTFSTQHSFECETRQPGNFYCLQIGPGSTQKLKSLHIDVSLT